MYPQGVTEPYFLENPHAYAQHPPTFLVQHSTLDENADTCAALNYHHAMTENGAHSELQLIPPAYERCACIGQPSDPDSDGSPFRQHCKDFPTICFANGTCHLPPGHEDVISVERCEMHTMGWSGMIEPLLRFVLNATASS